VEKRVQAMQGELVIRDMMTLSLSFDQHVMDGGTAARLLRDIKLLLESGTHLC
jgi:pyruvate dehydrogenase E2 component (dihydrolipoamide acetyltransferase)